MTTRGRSISPLSRSGVRRGAAASERPPAARAGIGLALLLGLLVFGGAALALLALRGRQPEAARRALSVERATDSSLAPRVPAQRQTEAAAPAAAPPASGVRAAEPLRSAAEQDEPLGFDTGILVEPVAPGSEPGKEPEAPGSAREAWQPQAGEPEPAPELAERNEPPPPRRPERARREPRDTGIIVTPVESDELPKAEEP